MASVHASVVVLGRLGLLVRGPSGSGKTTLCRAILADPHAFGAPFSRLVADDRVLLTAAHGRVIATAPSPLAGLIEVRGVGPLAVPHLSQAVIGLVIDLSAPDAARVVPLPLSVIQLEGVSVPRLPLSNGWEGVSQVRDLLRSGYKFAAMQE